MKKIFMLLSTCFVLTTVHAQEKRAGLFVEPMLTYERGDGSISYPSPVNGSDSDIDGVGLGARLGVHVFESVFLAMDGRYSIPNFEDTSFDQKTDAKSWNYGPVIGIQMPWDIGMRVWAGYVMGGELDPSKDNNVDLKFKDGQGVRVGAGLKLGIASLNLEYQDLTYKETEVESVGVFTPGQSFGKAELDNRSWIFSVSFPLSL